MITLATLSEATEQEVFDQVAIHLLSQNRKAIDGPVCAYHSPDGIKCAAGCLISEEEYAPTMEKNKWSSLVDHNLVPCTHNYLISDLQRVHDNYPPKDWPKELLNLGKRFSLNAKSIAPYQ